MQRTFLKEVRTLVERREATAAATAATTDFETAPFADWDFQQFIGNKLNGQLDRYRELPTLGEIIEEKLEQLFPLYAGLLDTGKEDSVQSHMLRFMAPNYNGSAARTAKLNNLRAHIIKHEIHGEYFEVSEFRRSQLSITTDAAVSSEMLVHTYTDHNMIQFAKLLHDETYLNSSYYNYYRRLSRLFFRIVGKDSRLSKKLRPADLERLIQLLLYSNKKLSTEERLELRLDRLNNVLLNDLQESGLKLSNKEMFALLQLTFRKAGTDSANVEMLYDKFMASDKFDKNGDFFKAFLNFNMSLRFSNERLAAAQFCRRIILDLVQSADDVSASATIIDRFLLKYLLKYSWLVHDPELTRLVTTHILEHYALDVETFNMIFAGVLKHDPGLHSPVLDQLLQINLKHTLLLLSPSPALSTMSRVSPPPTTETERFDMRLLDHLLEKTALVSPQMQPLCPGITHRLPLNPIPHDMLLRAVHGYSSSSSDVLGLDRPVVAEYLRSLSRATAQHQEARREQSLNRSSTDKPPAVNCSPTVPS